MFFILHYFLHYMSFHLLVAFIQSTVLWTIATGAIWGEVSQGHNDMLTAVGLEPATP